MAQRATATGIVPGVHPLQTARSPAARPADRHGAALHEIAEMWRFAHDAGFADTLKDLHRPRPLLSVGAASLDWALIAAAVAATLAWGWIAAPVALLVIGNRQRALGNLLHDASHWSFDGDRPRAVLLADLLLCWPLWTSMAVYRDEHNRHHKHLGDPARDPDFIHDETGLAGGWLKLWCDQLLSWRMFRGNFIGNLDRVGAADLFGALLWWGVALAMLATLLGAEAALVFAALWLAARATAFHAITAFREISDHVGLVPGSLIGFSRNHPFGGWLGQIIHPHRNGYHLLHHLVPGVPFHALPRAHALLLAWPPYAAGAQCDSYFGGAASATRSWVRRWAPGGAAAI